LLSVSLSYSRENLQANIEHQQATNEELKSSNEELQSANEELQSSNEEMATAREELQSLNEEAVTVNNELISQISQLTIMENDLKNLFDAVKDGTILLDINLCIRRFTKAILSIYPLVATDLGRPLSDISSNLGPIDMEPLLRGVLDTLIPYECDVKSIDGKSYQARIQPYRTLDNVIDGLVLSFVDISERVATQNNVLSVVQVARELAEGIVDSVSEPLVVLDSDLQVISASKSFFTYFNVQPVNTLGRKIYELGDGQWSIPALRLLLEKILPKEQSFEGYIVEHDFPGLGRSRMMLNARRIVTSTGKTDLILLAMVKIEKVD